MATIASALNTPFTPAAGSFIAQVSGGRALLQRRGTAGAAWVNVGELGSDVAPMIENPVAAAQYQFVAVSGTPVVQADQ